MQTRIIFKGEPPLSISNKAKGSYYSWENNGHKENEHIQNPTLTWLDRTKTAHLCFRLNPSSDKKKKTDINIFVFLFIHVSHLFLSDEGNGPKDNYAGLVLAMLGFSSSLYSLQINFYWKLFKPNAESNEMYYNLATH